MAKKPLSVITFAVGGTSGVTEEDLAMTAAGHLVAADSDPAATLSWTVAKSGVGVYGSLLLGQDGSWSYTLNNASAKVQALAAGQTATDSFSVKATDSNGAATIQVVTITVTGTEDLPVITVAAGQDHGAVQEDVTLFSSGVLKGSDVDVGAVLAWNVAAGGIGVFGTLSVAPTGKWSYALTPSNAAVQALAQGQHASDSFVVQLSDGQGGIATQAITLDVLGTNDAPVIAAAGSKLAGAVREDVTLVATGQVIATDADAGSSLSWTLLGSAVGSYGSLAVDQLGAWTYHLDNTAAQVQALDTGMSVTDGFIVQVSDGLGGVASRAVAITVKGTSEPVMATAMVDAGTTLQGQAVTLDVLLNDLGQSLRIVSASLDAPTGSLGLVGNVLVFTPGSAFDHLAVGETANAAGHYTIRDKAGAVSSAAFDITVVGVNDAPVVNGPLQVAAAVGGAAFEVHLLDGATDPDATDMLHVANPLGLTDGVILVGDVLVVDPTDPAFAGNTPGSHTLLTLAYDVVDGHGAASLKA